SCPYRQSGQKSAWTCTLSGSRVTQPKRVSSAPDIVWLIWCWWDGESEPSGRYRRATRARLSAGRLALLAFLRCFFRFGRLLKIGLHLRDVGRIAFPLVADV